MGLSFQAARILERLHNAIQTQGQRSLDGIRARQHDLAQNEKREVTEKDFVAATAGDGVIAGEEAGALFRELAGGGERMPFAAVLRALRCPTSRQRVVLARAVFDMIDQDKDGLLSHDQVIACYRAANHPDVSRGLRTCAEVRQDFIQTLRDMEIVDASNRGSMLTFPAFLDFYCSLTAFTSEEHFRETISTVWVPPVVMDSEHAFASKIIGRAGGLAANLRAQILRHGVKGVSTFRRGIRDAVERGGVGEISQEAFCASAGCAGAKLTASEMAEVCRYLDRRGTGMIYAVDALRVVLGELNEHRKARIDDTFDSLLLEAGASVDSTLDFTTVIRRFRAEAHPDVVSGTKNHQEVLAYLMEAFEGARLTGGRVTRSAWREHHWDISALINDDDAFCSYLERVWGARIKDSAEYRSAKPLKGSDRLMRASVSLPCDSTSCSDRPEEVSTAASARSSEDVLKTTPGPRQPYKEGNRQDLDASYAPREAWTDRPMTRHGRVVVEQDRRSARGAEACPSIPPGIIAILDRARGNLSARGVRGVSLLLKAFRKEDRRGKGMIKLSGFKTAAGSAGLGLKEKEMRILFECLDGAADGEIPYERFLQKIREPLPPHRLALVYQAFDGMDADRDGLALVEDITKAFRASSHPQVMEGFRDEEEVHREFLETFAVWDGARRFCARDDFIRWMELISLSLPTPANDSIFERLVRGCWGMPETTDGGIAAPPSVAEKRYRGCGPLRVVVTRADGSTSVEEVGRGLGSTPGEDICRGSEVGSRNGAISRAQAENIRQELAARGVHAVHVQLLPEQQRGGGVGNPKTTAEESCPLKDGRNSYSSHDVTIAKLGPAVHRNASDDSGGQRSIQDEGFSLNRGLQSVLDVVRERLASRGPAGFFTLSRLLRSSGFFRSQSAFLPARPCTAPHTPTLKAGDRGGNGPFVTLSSFKEILSEMGCGLNSKDVTHVFWQLDRQGRGEIPVEVALEAIRGRLTGVRLPLVRAVFSRLNGGGYCQGNVAAAAPDVLAHFDPQGHPDVVSARRCPEDVRKEFMDAMTTTNGLVTWKDFENYYADVSAAIPVDAYFILLVQGCWGLGATAVAKAASAATATAPPTNTCESNTRRNTVAGRRMYPRTKTSAHPGILPGTTHPANSKTLRFKSAGQHMRVPTAGVAAVLRKLRAEIQGQGTSWGLAGLRRALFHADRNRDGFLSFGEFKAALTSLQMEMAPGEMRALFGHLETEAVLCVGVGGGYTSGITSCQALVDAIRPPLSGERLGLVRLAFRKMDRRGEGRVSPETVAQRFDASKHPAVLKGHASVEEKRQELLDTFFSINADDGKILVNVKDVCPTDRGESDQISKEDFIEHHSDISFSVPSDTEFRQLVLKCWGIDSDSDHATDRGHMPPDEITTEEKTLKQACRTVTRRRNFVVTYLDGSQAVQELPFPSERRQDDEAPLTAAEEKALKHFLFRRDKIYAAEVILLPEGFQCGRPSSDSADPPPLSAEDPVVDRRSAWAWAPMSLSEIHTADKTAAAVGAGIPIISTGDQREDAGEGNRGNERHVSFSSRTSKVGTIERQKNNVPTGDVMHNSPDDRRVSEKSWGSERGDVAGGDEIRSKLQNQWKTEAEIDKDREADPSVRYLMSMVRSELNLRGVTGMTSLCRRLREAMTIVAFSGRFAKVVKEVDFLRALRETISPLTESDIRRIFSYFEIRDLGIMDPEAFVSCLYGYMSEKRKKLVLRVFDKLDTTGTGHVKLDQVLDAFHATKHPDVISGCRSPDVVFRDFVEGFVGGLPSDKRANLREGGTVTREDFCKYYDIVSATIPDNGYFELLLSSCWRMLKPVGNYEVAQDHGRDERIVNPRAESGGINDTLRGEIDKCRKIETACHHFQEEIGSSSSHCANAPVTLSPKQTRERSSRTQAVEGDPGGRFRTRRNGESNKLRAAHLARTFDTQIVFGEVRDERETHRHTHYGQAESTIPLDGGKTPLAAGGGRSRPMAEGAAWTPGGRRSVPGSRVFMSHLGNGMTVSRDEADRLIDQKSLLSEKTVGDSVGAPLDGDTRRWLNADKKSRAAAASREPPVWIPKQGRKSVKIASLSDTLANAGNDAHPSDSLCLTKFASNDAKIDASCSDTNESNGNMSDQQGSPTKRTPSPMKRASEDYARRALPCEEEWSPRTSSTCIRTAKAERVGVPDRWDDGHISGSGDPTHQDWRQRVAPQPRHPPSDTYRSSLVFG